MTQHRSSARSWMRLIQRLVALRHHTRPQYIPGCTTLLLFMCVVLLFALSLILERCSTPTTQVVASFNIENFPRHARQVEGAFAEIAQLRASAVGVQEIIEPELFAREAKARLGPSWRFTASSSITKQRVGVLWDSNVWTMVEQHEHREPAVRRGAKPALEVVLQPKGDGRPSARLHMMVIHLKSGGSHVETRRSQITALRPILDERIRQQTRLVLLGDFNSTGEDDRQMLAKLSRELGMDWASQHVTCTSYWQRNDGCLSTALDHMLTWTPAHHVRVGGACAEMGCETGESCPRYREDVSDHCPLVATFR